MEAQAPLHESRAAVFLDRDGTLIEDRGHLRSPSEVVLFPQTVQALRLLRDRFLLFIVTNQRGIAEGLLSHEDADRVNAHVTKRLAEAGVSIAEVYVCPHRRSEGCACIKPNPRFLRRAAEEYRLDLRRSYAVGDHPHDVELAHNVGACGIYVLTGHGAKHRRELEQNAVVVPGILEAARWIVEHHDTRRSSQAAPLPSRPARPRFQALRTPRAAGQKENAMALEGNGFGDSPEVAAFAYVHPQATVIGNVVIGERVLVCPHAVIRADEPGPDGTVQPIRIGDKANIQDTAVIHALGGSEVRIGEGTSLAHGAVIHGPCDVGPHCFIGFGSAVFKATLGEGVTVMHQALIEGVDLPPGLLVPSMTGVLSEEDVSRLSRVTPETAAFVQKVRHANLRLLEARAAERP